MADHDPIFDNAIDSLKMGMKHYRDEEFKFAVLLIHHSIELLLKERLRRIAPLLIYKNIDAQIGDDSPTIGLKDAVARLRNLGLGLHKDQIDALCAFKTIRNRIEHHSYEKTDRISVEIASALWFICNFIKDHLDATIDDLVDSELATTINTMVLENEQLCADAHKAIEEWCNKNYKGGYECSNQTWEEGDCPKCIKPLMIIGDPKLGNYCFFCKEAMDVFRCKHCGSVFLSPSDDGRCTPCADFFDSLIPPDAGVYKTLKLSSLKSVHSSPEQC